MVRDLKAIKDHAPQAKLHMIRGRKSLNETVGQMGAIEVRNSKIHGKGVFAARRIRKGELAVSWAHTKEISTAEFENLPIEDQNYIERREGRIFLVGEPERYVNHSCSANTEPGRGGDVAARDIEAGEEVTADYGKFFIPAGSFNCKCEDPSCRSLITGVPAECL